MDSSTVERLIQSGRGVSYDPAPIQRNPYPHDDDCDTFNPDPLSSVDLPGTLYDFEDQTKKKKKSARARLVGGGG